ncbi:hypothetical protein EBE87_12060 [Pseudoroseomonas wenyumeiae]|uniref:Uncharacterized protein n=1 Tax=Teichococcus wenyumeiae TaxID=2478470 RepID=A0A3A9JAD5_9PROT|nr:hypothetical protein D6Z83_19595 [Pseudoroseomonas wenyumeiae]RMI24911.1 hypothetical protein EBE87_12060 [Pseudoroseomonas wenyumeiae]
MEQRHAQRHHEEQAGDAEAELEDPPPRRRAGEELPRPVPPDPGPAPPAAEPGQHPGAVGHHQRLSQ